MKKYFLYAGFLGALLACSAAPGQPEPISAPTSVSPFRDRIVPVLINGETVPPGSGWDHVINIRTGSAGCTATVVGPFSIITAAHCAGNGATSTFTLTGKSYSCKMTRSPIYPGKDHDIAVGKCTSEIMLPPSQYPASIGGALAEGKALHLFGYGCTQPGGNGGNDGVLRRGKATVVNFSGYDAVSTNGAALCFGDSGGPGFLENDVMSLNGQATAVKYLLVSINSKGNIKDTNYTARLDSKESQDFLKSWAQTNSVEICGITAVCGEGPTPPGPEKLVAENAVAKATVEIKAAWLADPNNTVDFVKNALTWFMKYVAGEK